MLLTKDVKAKATKNLPKTAQIWPLRFGRQITKDTKFPESWSCKPINNRYIPC